MIRKHVFLLTMLMPFCTYTTPRIAGRILSIIGHSIAWALPTYEGYKGVNATIKGPMQLKECIEDTAKEFIHDEIRAYNLDPHLFTIIPSKNGFALYNNILSVPQKEEQTFLPDKLEQYAWEKLEAQHYSELAKRHHWDLHTYTITEIGWLLKQKKQLELFDEYIQSIAQKNRSFVTSDYCKIHKLTVDNENMTRRIQQRLERAKAAIGHELGHYVHNDFATSKFQKLLCATVVEVARLGLKKIIPFGCGHAIKNLFHIPSGCARLIGTLHLESLYKQHKELLADDFIRDDMSTLQAYADFHYMIGKRSGQEHIATAIKQGNPLEKMQLIVQHKLFRTHPDCVKRAKRIENRIAQLKKDTQTNACAKK